MTLFQLIIVALGLFSLLKIGLLMAFGKWMKPQELSDEQKADFDKKMDQDD